MKLNKLTLTLAILLASAIAFAQVPQGIQYQTVARDNGGTLLSNTSISLQITIRQGSANGTDVYQETHAVTTNDFGLASLVIGEGTPVSGTFPGIDWSNAPYFVNVALDPAGGSTFTDMGTSELMSVPFALYAASSAGSAWTADQNGISYNGGNVGVGRTSTLAHSLAVAGGINVDTVVRIGNSGEVFDIVVNSDGQLQFKRNGSTTQDLITLDDDSERVGIGTDMPVAPLHIGIALDVEPGSGGSFIIGDTAGLNLAMDNNEIMARAAGGSTADLFINNDGGDVFFHNGSASGLTMVLQDDGLIGIGTSTLTSDIHLKQSTATTAGTGGMTFEEPSNTDNWKIYHSGIHFSFSENGTRRAYVEGGTGNYVQPSDANLKKNIETIGTVLPGIMQLEPVRYHYNTMDDESRKTIGFLAQEVEKVFPEIVRESEDGNKALSYSDFAILSVKAIQEQQAQIEELKREIEALKNQ